MIYVVLGDLSYPVMFITGAGFGLSLVLNVEQYEYIRSPNTDAGIKVQFKEPLKSSDILITTMFIAI